MTVICEHIGEERKCRKIYTFILGGEKKFQASSERLIHAAAGEKVSRWTKESNKSSNVIILVQTWINSQYMCECAQGLFWFSYFLVILVDSSSPGFLALPEWTPTLSRTDSFFVVFLMFIGMSQAWALNERTRSKIVVYFWASLSALSAVSLILTYKKILWWRWITFRPRPCTWDLLD